MEPSLSIAARTAFASGVVTLAMAGLTVAFHGWIRWRADRMERRTQGLAGSFANYLTSAVATSRLRELSTEASGEVFWGALQRFAENIGGEEWSLVSRQLAGLRHLREERKFLTRGPVWRRAVAARRLGMIDDSAARETLRAALDHASSDVRLRMLLSLARLQDRAGLLWLLEHPQSAEGVAPSIVLAVLKRFGPDFTPEIRFVVTRPQPAGQLVVAAAEVLGFWRDPQSRLPLEQLLHAGGLEERVAAARALGNLGASEACTALAAALEDPAWQVRAQAARSLGRMPVADVLPRLERATSDMAWWVRRNASYAMTEFGVAGAAALRRIADSGVDRYASEMAVEALQALEWEGFSPGGIGRVG